MKKYIFVSILVSIISCILLTNVVIDFSLSIKYLVAILIINPVILLTFVVYDKLKNRKTYFCYVYLLLGSILIFTFVTDNGVVFSNPDSSRFSWTLFFSFFILCVYTLIYIILIVVNIMINNHHRTEEYKNYRCE